MSALAQQAPRLEVWLTELEATMEVGRQASGALTVESLLSSVAGSMLWVKGVRTTQVEPEVEVARYLGQQFTWGTWTRAGVCGCAVKPIRAGGWDWGNLRLYFELRDCALGSPLAFCGFVAEQIGCAFNRLALLGQRDVLNRRKKRFEHRLATRKAVERAKGILSQMHGIPDTESLKLLIEISRESRRSLRHVSQNAIFAYNQLINAG
jgi:ANTAR domain